MFQQLTERQRKYLAVGLLVLSLLMVGWLLVVPLVMSGKVYTEQVENLRFHLTKYEQAITNRPALETRLASLKTQLAQAQLFHSHIAPGVVAATVQNTIRQAVENSGGSLISTQVLPETGDSKFTRVAISVRLTGNDQVLQQLLYQLESARPLLLVEKAGIGSKRRPQQPGSGLPPLSITLEIASYLARDGA